MPNKEPSWPMFRRVWRRAKLTDRMIEGLGADPVVAARLDKGNAYQTACTNCLKRCEASNCRNRLNEAERISQPPDICLPNICLNVHFFERCTIRRKEIH